MGTAHIKNFGVHLMKHTPSPVFTYIFSMSVFGTIGLFVKGIPLPSGEVALCRAVLAIIFIAVFLCVTKQKIHFSKIKKELPLLFLSGAAMGFNWILLFEAYKYTTVSSATLSYYFAPVAVTAVSPLMFRERLTAKNIVCFIFATVGIVLVTGTDTLSGSTNFKGILFGLCAALLYASVILLNKYIKNISGIHRTFLQFISAAAVLLPYVLLTDGISFYTLGLREAALLCTVGLLHTGITYCLYFGSLSKISGQRAAILSYIDPLVAVILSVTVLGEPMSITQIAGGILILGFTLINEIPTKRF